MTSPTGSLAVPPLLLDRASPIPLYFQVATALQQKIEAGEVPVGTRLGNEVDLADQMGVSRPTMRRAIQYLVEGGMLVRKRGVGTEVLHPKVRRPIELSSLFDDLARAGRAPRTEVRSLEVVPAPDTVARALALPDGSEVMWIERLRFAGDQPIALMRNAVPLELLDLDARNLVDRGLYELLREAGHTPRIATQVIGARSGTAAESRILGVPRGSAVLTMTRTAWNATGLAVEYGAHTYPASRYSFELTQRSLSPALCKGYRGASVGRSRTATHATTVDVARRCEKLHCVPVRSALGGALLATMAFSIPART